MQSVVKFLYHVDIYSCRHALGIDNQWVDVENEQTLDVDDDNPEVFPRKIAFKLSQNMLHAVHTKRRLHPTRHSSYLKNKFTSRVGGINDASNPSKGEICMLKANVKSFHVKVKPKLNHERNFFPFLKNS